MSKIGKKPIAIPEGVTATVAGQTVSVKGPKGDFAVEIHPEVRVEAVGKELIVSVPNPDVAREKALWGTFRSLVQNAVDGVSRGFEKKLEINGVGYKAQASPGKLVLNLGYSHPIELEIPKGLEVKVEKNVISVSGVDRQKVGQLAALVRSQRKPEPYKGKGIRYQDEVVRRKAGKVVKAVGG